MRPAKRQPKICDAPGCTSQVGPGKLLCRPHWYCLPAPLREAISAAWKASDTRAWSANCLEARRLLSRSRPQERNAALRDRLLGERNDA